MNLNGRPDHQVKRIAIVGSGGRLGSSLAEFLRADHEVIGFDRAQLDLSSPGSIDAALGRLEYDLLFLTGALTAVDYCESNREEAFAANCEGPGRIAEISASKGAHVTYISTDFVFDGTKSGPYTESDLAHPISIYGASKLAGEERVMAASESNLVARVSWVYGPGRPAFPEWIVGKAVAELALTLPDDKIGCPTYTLDLIEWLATLTLGLDAGPASGIFHLCNSSPCTWREWGQFCIDSARDAGITTLASEVKGVPLDSVSAFVAKRPANSALSTEKFSKLTGVQPRDWKSALRDFVVQSESFAKYKLVPQSP